MHVERWQAWSPERQTCADWSTWAGGALDPSLSSGEEAAPVPLLLRRRVGALGQKALRAAWGMPASDRARFVFASRHGEFDRTLSILDSLTRNEPTMPADFTLSVHHALAGLLSIARSNRSGHTAVAAGRDSFCCGLLEAAACLAENPAEPVVFVYYDAPLPAPFADFDEDGVHVALALTLAAGAGVPIGMSFMPRTGQRPVSRQPASDFLRFLLGGAASAELVGERHIWHWTR